MKIDSKLIEDDVTQIQSRSMSDPPLPEIALKNKMVWVELPLKLDCHCCGKTRKL